MLFDDVYGAPKSHSLGLRTSPGPPARPSTGASIASSTTNNLRSDVWSVQELPTTMDDMMHGEQLWKNISWVVRKTFCHLVTTVDAQRKEIEGLKTSIGRLEAGLGAKADKSDLTVDRLRADFDAKVRNVHEKLARVSDDLELKADATYVTNCLLTKANKSDVSSVWMQAERSNKSVHKNVNQQQEERWEQLQLTQKSFHTEFTQNLEKMQEQLEAQRREFAKQLGSMSVKIVGLESAQNEKSMIVVEQKGNKGKVGQREFNELVKQVEKLAAVQTSTQNLLVMMEEKLTKTVDKDTFDKLSSEKANKLSVANAIHRKANKEEVAETLDDLETRVKKLERRPSTTGYTSSSSQSKKKPSSAYVDKRWNELYDELTKEITKNGESMKTDLTQLVEPLKKEIESLHNEYQRSMRIVHHTSAEPTRALGSQSVDALEGRIQAATQSCAAAMDKIAVLRDDFDSIDVKVVRLENHARDVDTFMTNYQKQLQEREKEQAMEKDKSNESVSSDATEPGPKFEKAPSTKKTLKKKTKKKPTTTTATGTARRASQTSQTCALTSGKRKTLQKRLEKRIENLSTKR